MFACTEGSRFDIGDHAVGETPTEAYKMFCEEYGHVPWENLHFFKLNPVKVTAVTELTLEIVQAKKEVNPK
jgi:hypothetical protein